MLGKSDIVCFGRGDWVLIVVRIDAVEMHGRGKSVIVCVCGKTVPQTVRNAWILCRYSDE